MPDFESWRAHRRDRAQAALRRIADRPTEIVVRRNGSTLSAQTVRVEFSSAAREDMDTRRGLNLTPGVGRATVFGVRDHPTAADTDLQRGDRFVIDQTEFEVIATIAAPGEIQALCEART